METYYSQMCQLSFRVSQLLALAIGLDEHYFDDAFQEPLASIRLLHYAAVESRPQEGIFACGAHSDYGMITLLLTDDNKGLQILTKSNEWIDAPPMPGAFVVNLGDMLERWTNGLFRSTQVSLLPFESLSRLVEWLGAHTVHWDRSIGC
jgi:isopenicillin N synthase-like dioxygenase